jgi:hypothetical protein
LSFQNRWYQNTGFNAVWSSPVPQGHFASSPSSKHPPTASVLNSDGGAKRSRISLAGSSGKIAPDFINRTPLLEAVVPFTSQRSLAQQILTRLSRTQFPKFETSSGTLTMCFLSAFVSPHNCCVLRKCVDRKRQPRLHVDLGQEPWRSKPEAFWGPLVQFLQDPLVAAHL